MRRNRKAQWCRELLAEVRLKPSDFIMPLFIIDGVNKIDMIPMMPNVFRYTIDKAIDKIKSLYDMGIQAVMLFPYIEQNLKSMMGHEAMNSNNLISRAIKEIKKHVPNIGVIADVALDPYTSHGHDGILDANEDVDNDETVKLLIQQALILADAGVDAVSPSDMMDGRIGLIRDAFEANKYYHTQIFAYSAKFHSSLYTPFREAIGSKNNLGKKNKKGYFLDYRNNNEALVEIELDIAEGADTIIIKPASIYLDIIALARAKFPHIPLFAYHVSGEYAMLTHMAERGIASEMDIVLETMYALKRAGARNIITYYADRVVHWEHTSVF
jgi:porphobilinogen synthase